MSEQWLKDISDRMSEFETDEPQGLWQAVETRRRKAAVVLWWRRVAVAAAVAAALGVGIYFALQDTSAPTPQRVVTAGARQQEPSQRPPQTAAEPQMQTPLPATERPRLAQASHTLPIAQTVAADTVAATPPSVADSIAQAAPEQPVRHALPPAEVAANEGRHTVPPAPAQQYASSDSYLQLALFTSGTMLNHNGEAASGDTGYGTLASDILSSDNSINLLAYRLENQSINKVEHHLPVRVGFAISFPLSDRISIGTGLTYTYLATDIYSGSVHSYLDSSQSVHFIGVPLSLSFRVFSVGRFDAYAIGGAMVEKAVHGRVHEAYILNGTEYRSDSYGTELPWQFSLNLSAGFQYNISPTIGIFAEPGLQYYLPDNSSLCTIYSDKPLNFSLNLGLRLTLPR